MKLKEFKTDDGDRIFLNPSHVVYIRESGRADTVFVRTVTDLLLIDGMIHIVAMELNE